MESKKLLDCSSGFRESWIAIKLEFRLGNGELTEKDSVLITYGDQLSSPGEKPLQTLSAFCSKNLTGVVGGIHILPFYPWTSDDGFSVADYRRVDPALGDWDDISAMQENFRLMFDGVINHISSQSEWFKAFLNDDPHYSDYFIVVEAFARSFQRLSGRVPCHLLTNSKHPRDKSGYGQLSAQIRLI